MRAVIFANGSLSQPWDPGALLKPDDILIAADGGAAHMLAQHLMPNAAIGDFDSLGAEEQRALEMAGVNIFRYPEKKDLTDLELAIRYAQSLGAQDILMLGALGNRWDQTLANLLLPAAAAYKDLRIHLVDENQEITLIRAGQTVDLVGRPGSTLSLIPLAGDAGGITTRGLEYALDRETLLFGSTRGISNVMLDEPVSVTLETGMLLCVTIRNSSENNL
jgi:thiamine pyrophosphokinase